MERFGLGKSDKPRKTLTWDSENTSYTIAAPLPYTATEEAVRQTLDKLKELIGNELGPNKRDFPIAVFYPNGPTGYGTFGRGIIIVDADKSEYRVSARIPNAYGLIVRNAVEKVFEEGIKWIH